MSDVQMLKITADKISKLTGFSPEEVAVIKNTVAKGTTDIELAFFLNVCKSVGLNPCNKEVWCYKDKKENLLIFAGRDGFLRKAQESKLWNGMTSFEVCENDEFEIDIGNQKVNHKPNIKNRGKILGAYAMIKPKGCELATIEWVSFNTYNKGQFTWTSYPADMIKKCAETHALKKAFGITGLQSEYDYNVENGTVAPIEPQKSGLQIATENLIMELDLYKGKDKEEIRKLCQDKQKDGTITLQFIDEIMKKIGVPA